MRRRYAIRGVAGWRGDNMLAQMGMLVFRCDPRSASGKGACSTWTAYKQLGVQELKDIKEAIEWPKTGRMWTVTGSV